MTRYFDHAATTAMDSRLVETWAHYTSEPLNSSSVHQSGQKARRYLEQARERIASVLDVESASQVLFTSGATESANLALRGSIRLSDSEKPRIISSRLEHSCIVETIEELVKNEQASATELPINGDGHLVLDATYGDADVFCGMHVNNETGVIQDIRKLKDFHRRHGGVWICDGSQSVGKIPVSVKTIGCDLFLVSAHKFYGPVGIGCVAGPHVEKLRPQITGGPQEDNRRAGTQAVALAMCFAQALEIASEEMHQRTEKLDRLETAFLARLQDQGIKYMINGGTPKLSGFLNLTFPGHEGIDMVIALDQMDCSVSPGSACSTGVVAVSPVLKAMFPNDESRAAGGVRISFGQHNTFEDAGFLADCMGRILLQKK